MFYILLYRSVWVSVPSGSAQNTSWVPNVLSSSRRRQAASSSTALHTSIQHNPRNSYVANSVLRSTTRSTRLRKMKWMLTCWSRQSSQSWWRKIFFSKIRCHVCDDGPRKTSTRSCRSASRCGGDYVTGIVQDCGISSVLAVEIPQSCTMPWKSTQIYSKAQ